MCSGIDCASKWNELNGVVLLTSIVTKYHSNGRMELNEWMWSEIDWNGKWKTEQMHSQNPVPFTDQMARCAMHKPSLHMCVHFVYFLAKSIKVLRDHFRSHQYRFWFFINLCALWPHRWFFWSAVLMLILSFVARAPLTPFAPLAHATTATRCELFTIADYYGAVFAGHRRRQAHQPINDRKAKNNRRWKKVKKKKLRNMNFVSIRPSFIHWKLLSIYEFVFFSLGENDAALKRIFPKRKLPMNMSLFRNCLVNME